MAHTTRRRPATSPAFDYINKMSGGIEEGDETLLLLDVLATADMSPAGMITVRNEADEILRIFVASRSTAIRRQQQQLLLKKQRRSKRIDE